MIGVVLHRAGVHLARACRLMLRGRAYTILYTAAIFLYPMPASIIARRRGFGSASNIMWAGGWNWRSRMREW